MDLMLSLSKALDLWPDRKAIRQQEKTFTYREFGERVARLARALLAKGVVQGKAISIIAPNVHEFLEAYYACAALGAVLNPINFRLSAREAAFIINDSEAVLLLAHTDFKDTVAGALDDSPLIKGVVWMGQAKRPELEVPAFDYEGLLAAESPEMPPLPDLRSNDLAHLYYTSGTTGRPKGVMLTQGNVTFHALAAIAELKLADRDTWIHVAPLFHLADAWATFALTWVGGAHVLTPYFEPGLVLEAFDKEKITITNLIPTMLNLMVNHPKVGDYDYSSLRAILSGGAPIAPETVRRIVEAFGCDYIQTYGMTETSPYLTVSILKNHLKDLEPQKQLEIVSRTGRAFIGVELKVVRPDGSAIAADNQEVGEIIVKGPIVTPGYWNRPQATEEALRDGWLYTGDLAVIDREGYVNIVDRAKDMIVTGGENVYSTEVEYVLYEHPDVLECAVIGVPDETWGEAVKAVIVTRPDGKPDENEIIEFVKQRLARFKAPKSIDFVREIPKTGSGKLYKKALKDKYWQGKKRRIG
ncbi:long-chain-fatty-acid--CoA ligase [Dethiosulfatarculus sandiegensis]|uniref:long-chain-fatty-acid--CoA ligase n=1 Tax=Dethiosulfatarculus sandiegensis TaxID=1429043 RepID=UPI0006990228|nr:long-chain-fatty-acid--CoA ligase [Dethiosulfatarculus sandiegensis]